MNNIVYPRFKDTQTVYLKNVITKAKIILKLLNKLS